MQVEGLDRYLAVMTDPTPMLDDLRRFFDAQELPQEIQINTYSRITDVRQFIKNHLMIAIFARMKKMFLLFMILLDALCGNAQDTMTTDPDAAVITSDVVHFWKAFDEAYYKMQKNKKIAMTTLIEMAAPRKIFMMVDH
jgi:hypothetical protein